MMGEIELQRLSNEELVELSRKIKNSWNQQILQDEEIVINLLYQITEEFYRRSGSGPGSDLGEKIYVNDSIGNVIVLDVQKKYLILFRENNTFIKANDYFIKNDGLVWSNGEYYNTFNDLLNNLKR